MNRSFDYHPGMASRLLLLALLSIAMLSDACATRPSIGPEAARELIDESAEAMGGWEALDSLKSQELRTSGSDWEPLQAVEPNAAPRQVNTFEQTMYANYVQNKVRIAFEAMRMYPTSAAVRFIETIDGEVGMLESTGADGKVVRERLHPSRFAARLRDFKRLPARVLYAARDAPDLARAEDANVDNIAVHVLKYTDGGLPVELHLNGVTKLPARVIYMEDDPVYGDVPNAVTFSDWKESGGVKFPETLLTFLNGRKIREERVVARVDNPLIGDDVFSIPDEIRAQAENGQRIASQWTLRRAVMGVAYQDFAREQKVELYQIARGVYHVRGGSHHSMVVAMRDHLVVVEAPLFEERSLAVLEALGERFPGKPVTHLVVTHFHFDHVGGVRAYAAKGATIFTPESIAPFIQEMLKRPHTLRPDTLAKTAVEPRIEGVAAVKVISDGERTIELRSIENDHAAGMLAAYLPAEKIVFVSDLYSPPGPAPNPSVIFEPRRAAAFYKALVGSGLKVDTIVGGHGTVGSFRDFERAVKRGMGS